MDKPSYQVRIELWKNIIKDQAASGVGKSAWCRDNGVNPRAFFYWQRKLRNMALEELNVSEDNHLPRPSQPYTPSTTFCEISAPVKNQSDPPVNISSDLTIEINGCRVLIGNSFSKESLASVIEVLKYV